MADVIISPNMGLPVPVPGVDPGPDWANNINACLGAIDSHNHSPGQGVQISPAGININADLPMGNNNLTTVRSVRFNSQVAPLAAPADIGCLYESGADLYYNDGAGNQVRITQSGSVTGASGTITGLPSGTASASFAGGTFTFQSATNTPATMALGPLVLGSQTANPKTVTIAPSASQPANYNITLPLAAPAADQVPISDASGNLSWTKLSSGTFSPTYAALHISGGTVTIVFGGSDTAWYYTRIGNVVTVEGTFDYTVSGFSSTANYDFHITIPIPTTTLNGFVAGKFGNSPPIGSFVSGILLGQTSIQTVRTLQVIVFTSDGPGLCNFSYSYVIN